MLTCELQHNALTCANALPQNASDEVSTLQMSRQRSGQYSDG